MSLGVSLKKLSNETGLSASTIRRALDRAGVTRKVVGRSVLYASDEVLEVLGFDDENDLSSSISPPRDLVSDEATDLVLKVLAKDPI